MTPPLDMDNTDNEILSFDLAVGYYDATCLRILVGVPSGDSLIFEDITSQFNLPMIPTTGYGAFQNAGSADLSAYQGGIYIAFEYSGDEPNSITTTYQIDNVSVTGTPTAINNLQHFDVVLFPNPANTFIQLNRDAESVIILDQMGETVKMIDNVIFCDRIDISGLRDGIYFVKIKVDDYIVVNKLVVKQ